MRLNRRDHAGHKTRCQRGADIARMVGLPDQTSKAILTISSMSPDRLATFAKRGFHLRRTAKVGREHQEVCKVDDLRTIKISHRIRRVDGTKVLGKYQEIGECYFAITIGVAQ